MDAQPEGDADAVEVMAEATEVPEGAEGEEEEELPQAEVVAADVIEDEKDAGSAGAVATETEVVYPDNRVRPKFESKLVAVNDKGRATMKVFFGVHVAPRHQV